MVSSKQRAEVTSTEQVIANHQGLLWIKISRELVVCTGMYTNGASDTSKTTCCFLLPLGFYHFNTFSDCHGAAPPAWMLMKSRNLSRLGRGVGKVRRWRWDEHVGNSSSIPHSCFFCFKGVVERYVFFGWFSVVLTSFRSSSLLQWHEPWSYALALATRVGGTVKNCFTKCHEHQNSSTSSKQLIVTSNYPIEQHSVKQ